ncbi:DNA polymerase III subunits gamma and tau [Burkholderia cenocepacia]|uniref:DNA polymerase III subunit gamma/tau n=1 Tax=Burkholderia cenocepacia TaxID=95486 RepID=UPI00198D52AB|nr:DNA polymerase III subunit gamma/tau [Burkholderia cenocepacia]CAB5088907.1 DNA polymerase III subunits gamma and tau [Burkholderia cenocepacia]CAB5121215.1 DNA polymerase III subunits gamma and tau [Burkholderia cenocepacia]CAB5149540.1 DNA polymerase III subunits gamma and tau [Burkholderia cenocepacia]CAB5158573.1 DNA polymerase III subunits gamma and tau [Burkholderia cenocepacia]CAB5161948.1 DNA polymerase III subunits gamma and tau [Burkholderia cenocepacia]
MTYQVLARKWRPKDFASLVGQEHVVRALTHALDGGRLHHAYLFTGTRGVGKTTLSRIFAKALNCETGVTSQPCGVCRACREIDEGRFVDYVEMDAASNRGVDEMAALLERAVYAPVDARFKVYMIDEVHMLTNHAFNAMLKTLEEPPPHVKFILATTDPQKIPVTVLSRCLQFNLKQMPAGHIVSHLERILGEERITFEPQALRLLARAAQGSMRDALSLTDQAIAYSANEVTESAVSGMLGALDQTYMVRLLDALAAGHGPEILAIADEMSLRSLSFSTALQDLASLLHRIAWAQFAPGSVLDEWPEAADLRRFAETLSPEQVQLFYQIATVGRAELGLAPDEYAGFTMTLLRMLAFEPAVGAGSAPGGQPSVPPRAVPAPRATAAPAAAAAKPISAAPASAARPPAATPAAPVARSAQVQSSDEAERPTAKPAAVQSPAEAAPEPVAADVQAVEPPQPETKAAPAGDTPPPARKEPEPPAVAVVQRNDEPAPQAEPAPRVASPEPAAARPAARAGGAAAALDVLRNAGMRVSSDRGRAGAAAKPAAAQLAAEKPVAPRPAVQVPTPRAAARAPQAADSRQPSPPWEDIPPDDYVPLSADEMFGGSDDGFVPVFDSGPDDVRVTPKPADARPAAPIDTRPLPPAIALDPIGFDGEWPALAARLPLKGVAYQLAFNSELTAVDATALKLSVPVPQYADAAQVAKLKAALADALGKPVEVTVEVGPARRTAAALDAAARAARQREAEQEIHGDPFVQQLVREFGARIVEGSVRPLADSAPDGAPPTLH